MAFYFFRSLAFMVCSFLFHEANFLHLAMPPIFIEKRSMFFYKGYRTSSFLSPQNPIQMCHGRWSGIFGHTIIIKYFCFPTIIIYTIQRKSISWTSRLLRRYKDSLQKLFRFKVKLDDLWCNYRCLLRGRSFQTCTLGFLLVWLYFFSVEDVLYSL